jgi:NAD+ synthase
VQTEATIQYIVQWLRDYASNSGTKGFVVGVSGGIDSAVTASLCARTELPVILLDMPIYQAQSQVTRGQNHIKSLISAFPNVRSQSVELSGVFDALIAALPRIEESPLSEMALVNARARLRMTTLYYFAGLENKLVAGTGNKVEDFGVGFFTKYGDGGVDLSPIADLMKSEVYALGKALGVSEAILSAPPTDGLWGDDRTDEEQIGATYPELEWAMTFSGDEDNLDARQREVLAIYRRLHRINQHKILPIPVCEIPTNLR